MSDFDTESNNSAEESAPAPSLPSSSMHISVRIPHCDPRVVTPIYMMCDSYTWHRLSQYDFVYGLNCYVHVRHDHCKSFHRMAYAVLHPHVRLHPKALVDHKSQQKLDCRATNLRLTDHKGNAQNRGKRMSKCSSRYVHVHACPRGWRAEVQTTSEDGVRHRRVSYHATELAAARAADDFARELHGEFASLNFPPGAGGGS